MIRHCIRNSSNVLACLRETCHYSTSTEKWDLQTAICLEKRPIVMPALTDIEKSFQNVLQEIERENSLKSDFEIQNENDVKQLEMLKKGVEVTEEINLKQTAQDLLDMWTEEFKQFTSTYQLKDVDNIRKMIERQRLDRHLVLLTNKEANNKSYYTLPLDYHKKGETLRQSAERILQSQCGDDMTAQIFGNAPCGFYKFKYPTDFRNKSETVGAKVFIYFARFIKGNIDEKEKAVKWVDRSELAKMLHPTCHKAVSGFLITE